MTYQFIEKKNYVYCDPMGYLHTEPFIIYNLVDPSDNQIRYIGQTTNGIKRLVNHFAPYQLKTKNYKNSWIKSVQAKGLKPIVLITHKANSREELNAKEKELIETFNKCVNLTNFTVGGDAKSRLNPKPKKITYRKWSNSPDYKKRVKSMQNKQKTISLKDQHDNYYSSISEAANIIKSTTGNIRKHLNGIHSHVKGYKFMEIVKGDTAQQEAYISACLAVKAKYPK